MSDYYPLFISLYALVCILVAAEASFRGWNFFPVFMLCLIASPLIGAIMYSPYKRILPATENKEAQKTDDPALVNLISSLETKH